MIPNRNVRQEAHPLFRENRWRICGMLALTELIIFVITAVFAAAINTLLLSFSARLRLLTISRTLLEHLPLITLALYLLMFLLIGWLFSGMFLGLCRGMIGMVRGQELRFSTLFSQMRQGLKGFWLLLLITFKMLLWMIPGAMLQSELLIMQRGFHLSDTVMFWGSIACSAVMMALAIPCLIRHAFCFHIIADAPETGVRSAVARSKYLLRYWKFQLFRLCIPYWLVYTAILSALQLGGRYILLHTAAIDLQQVVIGVICALAFVVSLGYTGYAMTAQTVFYERIK